MSSCWLSASQGRPLMVRRGSERESQREAARIGSMKVTIAGGGQLVVGFGR